MGAERPSGGGRGPPPCRAPSPATLRAGVDEGLAGLAERALGGFPGHRLDVEEREGGVVEPGLAAGAVDEDEDGGDLCAGGLDDVDGLLDAAAAGDDVLGDDVALAGEELEAAHGEGALGVFLGEDALRAQGLGHLVAHEDAAEGGGDDAVHGADVGLCLHAAHELGAEGLGVARPAQDLGALEIAVGMELGAELEMALKQRLRLFENGKHFIVCHGRPFH